jgi:hypothetical protein
MCYINAHGDRKRSGVIQFFIISMPSQQLQHQLQTQHNVDIGNKMKSNNNSIININSIKAN